MGCVADSAVVGWGCGGATDSAVVGLKVWVCDTELAVVDRGRVLGCDADSALNRPGSFHGMGSIDFTK